MFQSQKKQSGFSMVEVLVSLLVIGIGLLGLSSLQIASMKGTSNAHSRNVASMLGMELADRMRANRAGVQGGFYQNDVDCETNEPMCRNFRSCTPQETARYDVQEIMCGYERAGKRQGGVANLLPNGSMTLTCVNSCSNDSEPHNITLSWFVSQLHSGETNPSNSSSITISVTP